MTEDAEPYQVVVDQITMGTIESGGIRKINLRNGSHTIFVKKKDMESDPISFEFNQDQTVEFTCGPKTGNSKFQKFLYKHVFSGKGLYIKKSKDFYL